MDGVPDGCSFGRGSLPVGMCLGDPASALQRIGSYLQTRLFRYGVIRDFLKRKVQMGRRMVRSNFLPTPSPFATLLLRARVWSFIIHGSVEYTWIVFFVRL